MYNILIAFAVQEEKIKLNIPNCTFHYCKTGVGKVSAAIAVEKGIAKHNPDLVLNIGTAGTLHHKVGSVHTCKSFIDRDMEKLQNFGLSFKEDFTSELKKFKLSNTWQFNSVCNTGDSFLTSADGTGDVFDMEAFAIARVCKSNTLPFFSIKCVTDIIGQNSVQHWEDKLSEAQSILQNFMNDTIIIEK